MQISERALWSALQQAQIVSEQMPVVDVPQVPWYIRCLLGFAGWVSALLLFVFVGFVLMDTIFDSTNLVALLLGFVCCAIAFAIFRSAKSQVFRAQLALAFNLCGQLLLGVGLYNFWDELSPSSASSFERLCLSIFLLQGGLTFLMPNFTSRVLSSWFAMAALYLVLANNGLNALFLPIVALLFIGLWMNDHRWKRQKTHWEAIGFGLVMSLLMGSNYALWLLDEFADFNGTRDGLQQHYLLGTAILTLCLCYLINAIRGQYQIVLPSKLGLGLVLVAVVLSVLSYFIQGASAGFLLIIVGFLKQRRLMLAIGILSLLGFVSWYYYSLSWTLLYKSILLMVLAVVFGVALLIVSHRKKITALTSLKLGSMFIINPPNLIVIAMMGFILAAVNVNIYHKEQILAEGRTVLLKLAPIDPRSIMQGDYMRLSFALENQVIAELDKVSQGLFVAQLDAFNVGTYSHLYNGQGVSESQVKMQYRVRHNKLQLATHAFFFQEGSASEFEAAVYAEFRVADNGELLLNALRDKNRQVIGYHRPGN